MQLCEALYVCSFFLISNGHARVTAPFPAEVESEAFDFMQFMRVIVSGGNCDRRFIINMDQTPVYFSMSSKWMFEVIGEKTIHICMSTNDTKRVTVAVTITADGTLLPSTLVFKGKPNGRIAT